MLTIEELEAKIGLLEIENKEYKKQHDELIQCLRDRQKDHSNEIQALWKSYNLLEQERDNWKYGHEVQVRNTFAFMDDYNKEHKRVLELEAEIKQYAGDNDQISICNNFNVIARLHN
jgi:hypothetical protein